MAEVIINVREGEVRRKRRRSNEVIIHDVTFAT